jgi:prepilin-type N-terminal cleavage/methylation domain-containing protein
MKKNGFSLVEMLIVIAFIAIAVGVGIPLINEQVRIAEVRAAADEIATHLRAARMLAVSQRRDVEVVVTTDPGNKISYKVAVVPTDVVREMAMPNRVKIVSGSTTSIVFHSDGSTGAASTVTTESAVSTKTERWTLTVNIMGMVSVAHTRV